jgi:hypothetical protein
MYYTDSQIKIQEEQKKAFADKNYSNWEKVGIGWKVEVGRVIVSKKAGRLTIIAKDLNTIKFRNETGKEYTFKKFDVYLGLATEQLTIEYK